MSSPLGLDASSSVASIVVIGDSNSEGTGATSVLLRWQYLLQQKLRARLQPVGVTGAAVPYISASPRVSPPYGDYPRTATGGVTTASYGLGIRAAAIVASDTVTFTFTGTRAKLYGTKGAPVGKYSIKIDGGAETVVDGVNATVISGQLIWDSGTLTAGAHTVVVARAASTVTSPGPVYPEGLMTYNGDAASGVRVVDAARHGATLATFTGSNTWWTALGAVEGAQLLIMPWGANDSTSGTTAAQFKAALNQIIADTRSAGFTGTVLLLKMPKRGTADATLWANYMTQIDAVDLADANVLVLDLRPSIPDQGTPEAIALGLYADEVHFSDAGHALIADLLATAILGDEPSEDGFESQVWAAFGANLAAGRTAWSWTNLSDRTRAEPARIRAGLSAGARQASPSSGTLSLDSPDGALIPGNPLSVYWPNVDRGTPLLMRIRWAGIWYDRMAGYADQWLPVFTPTSGGGMDSFVRVTASGILRRLSQGAKPARSAPARYIPTTSPVAYWTLEDGQSVREGAATVGRSPMFPFTGTHPSGAVLTFAQWGRGELAPWLPEALSRSGSAGLTAIWGRVAMPANPGRWVVDFMYRSGTDAGDSTVDVNPSYLGGSLAWPQLLLLPSVRGVDVAVNGESEVTATASSLYDGQPHHIRWDVYQAAAKVSWNVYVDGVMVNFGTTVGNMTLPAIDTLGLTAAAQGGADMAQQHIAVWVIPPPLADAVRAAFGYAGETASARVTRLCAEEGIPVTITPGGSERLGPQGAVGVLELLQEAAEADEGILAEDGFGLAYVPYGARYRRPVAMTVDLATYRVTSGGQLEVLAPTLDDQRLRNRWAISRPDGIEVTANNVAHQQKVGLYDDSAALNLETDGRLIDHATWRVYQGTLPGLNEQTFPLDLAANRDLVGAWLACRPNSRIVRTNPPFPHPPGDIDRLVMGWTESISPTAWTAQVTSDPAAAWEVAVVDGTQRVGGDGATLSSSVTSTATTMLLATPAAMGLWTVRAGAFPFDLMVGGERVTVTTITGASSPQSATVVRSVNGIVKAHSAGASVQVAVPAIVGL